MEPRGTKNKFSAIVESIPQQTERPLIDINLPLTDNFPAIEELWTIKASGDEFLVGAGLLSDGLVVPLFLSEASAKETIQKLEDGSHIAVGMYAERLQSPIKAMRSAASQGAAGFQIQETAEDKNFDETIIQFSSGRILFPFLCRIEELSYPFPTVIGTALKCAEGVYLTSLGERSFDDFSLSQWINWKLMDRASAKMSIDQPFRSHNSGDSFWCLSTEKNTVGIYGNYGEDNELGVKVFQNDTLVLFAEDNILHQFCPPEGYLPIFCSEAAAEEFLSKRLGGAFHILMLDQSDHADNYVNHIGLKAQELQENQKGLVAEIQEIKNLPNYLSEVSMKFLCPPWFSFVVNPAGHREDIAWGLMPQKFQPHLKIKGVSAFWQIDDKNRYLKLSDNEYFDNQDTIYYNEIGYDFTNLAKSYASEVLNSDNEDLNLITELEFEDIVTDKLSGDWKQANLSDNPCSELIYVNEIDTEEYLKLPVSQKTKLNEFYKSIAQKWVVRLWQTVDGEKGEPEYFDSFLDLAGYLVEICKYDEELRVAGSYGGPNIGFEGSSNKKLEFEKSNRFFSAVKKLCLLQKSVGYSPSHSLSLMIMANRLFKSVKISICGYGVDLIASHIENSVVKNSDLFDEIGIPPLFSNYILEGNLNRPHGPSYDALIKKIGENNVQNCANETISFITTSLFNFESLGGNHNFDYAPVSVQVVKALEFEVRRLFRLVFLDIILDEIEMTEKNEHQLVRFIGGDDTAVTLGYLANLLRKSRNSESYLLIKLRNALEKIRSDHLISKKTTDFILRDVLQKYRNGGAHDSLINLQTCEDCISTLIGDGNNLGLVFLFARASKSIQFDSR